MTILRDVGLLHLHSLGQWCGDLGDAGDGGHDLERLRRRLRRERRGGGVNG